MTDDPELIRLLHYDVKSGTFDKVQAVAEKIKVFDRGLKTDLEYYELASKEIAQQFQEEQRRTYDVERQRLDREAKLARQAEIERVRKTQERQKEVEVKAVERKAATPTSRKAVSSKVVDYLDDSDEAFEDWYKANVLDKI
jgi:serine phosphatase RsbU (regulator of sigma subunit)